MKRLVYLWIAAAAWLFAAAVPAAPVTFYMSLVGSAENPPNASTGTGVAVVEFDPVAHLMDVHVEFSGLVSPTTVAHIHCCTDPPGNVMVATTTPTFPGFPAGVLSGTYDHLFDMTLASSYNAAFITAHGGTIASAEADLFAGLVAGRAYLNVHSQAFPSGEIRGFAAIPEPASVALLAAAAIAAGFARRRRAT